MAGASSDRLPFHVRYFDATFFSLLSFYYHIVFFLTYATHELVAIPLLPANNCVSLKILLSKEDLSELQPFPGKLILGF